MAALNSSVAKLFLMSFIDDQLIEKAEKYVVVRKRKAWARWGIVAAYFCVVAALAVTIMPKYLQERGAGMDGGKQPISGGINEGCAYSVAVLPADRNHDDVQDAYCNEISEAEIQNIAGLRDYLPSKLPDGYRFGQASLYVTTMKDGTIYRRLLITYRTGKGAHALPNEEEAEMIPAADGLEEEFRVNVFSFMSGKSTEIYSVEEVRSELKNGGFENGYFYVQYGDCYVGIEPLSLSTEEILDLIDGIGR